MKLNRNRKDNIGSMIDEPTLVLFLLFITISICPGIIIAAVFNLFYNLSVLHIWLVALISTVVVGALFYYLTLQKDLRYYYIVCLVIMGMVTLFTLFNANNFIAVTFKKMLPFIFN